MVSAVYDHKGLGPDLIVWLSPTVGSHFPGSPQDWTACAWGACRVLQNHRRSTWPHNDLEEVLQLYGDLYVRRCMFCLTMGLWASKGLGGTSMHSVSMKRCWLTLVIGLMFMMLSGASQDTPVPPGQGRSAPYPVHNVSKPYATSWPSVHRNKS